MTEPGSGTRPTWKERVKLVFALARWETAATLSSRGLWMARHLVPGLIVCALAAFFLFQPSKPAREVQVRTAAEGLGQALLFLGFGLTTIGVPILVYTRFEEARRTGMLGVLLASPISRPSVLLYPVLGQAWVAGHCLFAAAPAIALAWLLGAYPPGEIPRALVAILAGGFCATGFGILLAVKGARFEGFVLRYVLWVLFAPASMPALVWVPAAVLYIWFGAYSPFVPANVWGSPEFSNLQGIALGLGMPLQALASGIGGKSSAPLFFWGTCGAVLWSGATLALALRIFSSRDFAPAAVAPLRPGPRSPVEYKLEGMIERVLLKHLFLLSGRNPFVGLFLRRGDPVLEVAPSLVVLGILAVSPFCLFGSQHSILYVSEALLMVFALLTCHRTSNFLAKGTAVPSELLSSPLGGMDVAVGAAVACLWVWPSSIFFVVLLRSLTHGLAAFPCYASWALGALLLAMAVGIWLSPIRGKPREKTLAGFIFFSGIYFFLALATFVRSDPVHCLLLGLALQAIALALITAFPYFFRRLTRVSISS